MPIFVASHLGLHCLSMNLFMGQFLAFSPRMSVVLFQDAEFKGPVFEAVVIKCTKAPK